MGPNSQMKEKIRFLAWFVPYFNWICFGLLRPGGRPAKRAVQSQRASRGEKRGAGGTAKDHPRRQPSCVGWAFQNDPAAASGDTWRQRCEILHKQSFTLNFAVMCICTHGVSAVKQHLLLSKCVDSVYFLKALLISPIVYAFVIMCVCVCLITVPGRLDHLYSALFSSTRFELWLCVFSKKS